MKLRFIRFFLVLGTLVAFCAVSEASRANTSPVVSIRNNPDFVDVNIQLQALVNAFGFHSINQFCIITYGTKSDRDRTPLIYWPTQNKLIEWGIGSALILGSNHYFDLTRDVLPDGVPSIDYWNRSDVNHLIQDCRARGDKFIVEKTSVDWVSIDKYTQFASVLEQLQYLVNNASSHAINNFCVIGQKDKAFLAAYVDWTTENRLIMWLPDKDDANAPIALYFSDVQIDLKHSLRKEEDAKDDRNEMQQSYAKSILNACQQYGQTFSIKKLNKGS